jgi:hypothetical protein
MFVQEENIVMANTINVVAIVTLFIFIVNFVIEVVLKWLLELKNRDFSRR